MKTLGLKGLVSALALATISLAPASASTLGGVLQVLGTSDVIATFTSSDAGFTSQLWFQKSGGDQFLFQNHSGTEGTTVDLGSFAVGTILTFYLKVLDTGNVFFTGDGSLNADGLAHTMVDQIGNVTSVGFEDQLGGGDRDFNDLNFSFSNTKIAAAPLPAGGLMLVAGLGGLAALKRRKKSV